MYIHILQHFHFLSGSVKYHHVHIHQHFPHLFQVAISIFQFRLKHLKCYHLSLIYHQENQLQSHQCNFSLIWILILLIITMTLVMMLLVMMTMVMMTKVMTMMEMLTCKEERSLNLSLSFPTELTIFRRAP